jgi:phenylpropionate dioxygenase-like ring-hydroxylating dioxygenase large terminal subunit
MTFDSQQSAWPLLASRELVERNIVSTRLSGVDFAVWRDDRGVVNVWEDRCPHRGVRLTIGTNFGTELRCRYHGWRFASGSGICNVIPAHPMQPPPASARAKVMTFEEKYGFVWLLADRSSCAPTIAQLEGQTLTTLRSLAFDAPAAAVRAALDLTAVEEWEPHGVLFVMPESDMEATVHGVLPMKTLDRAERARILKELNGRLTSVRTATERRQDVKC